MQQEDHAPESKAAENEPAGSVLAELRGILGELATRLWAEARDRRSKDWPPAWLVFAALIAGIGITLLLVVPLVRGLLFAAGSAIAALGGWFHGQAYTQVVLAPVHSYLATHANGVPLSAETLWWTWCVTGPLMLIMCMLRWVAGRVGWVLYGLATAAMVAAGTPGNSRWVAAGAAGILWVLLSIPAFARRRPTPTVEISPPVAEPAVLEHNGAAATLPESVETEDVTEQPLRDDYAAWAASMYEKLLRRSEHAPPAATATTWTATATGPTAFTATDGTREVCGIVLNAEAAEDLLTHLSDPPGARTVVRWMTNPVRTPRRRRTSDEGYAGPPSLLEFVRGSTTMLDELGASVIQQRERWSAADVDEQIVVRANLLNRTKPLISDSVDYVPGEADGDYLGGIFFNGWIDLDSVVGGNASRWNDFASHRPKVVGMIIRKLLSAEDPASAATEIMTDIGHVHLRRYLGPGGPIHRIADNGTHRTHALRILGVPILAAQIYIEAVPLRIHAMSTWGHGNWGESYDGPADDLWRALRERQFLSGTISGRGADAVLEPYQVAAPWLLGSPRSAAAISAAYERVYPGALGIPPEAMAGPDSWLRWLLGKSR